MFAATNIISTPTNTTSLFSSTRRHHQPSSSRRPHPFLVCASSLKSTQKQQEKDDRKTVDDVDRRDVLTKAALVASVAMTTMTPKPVRARTFCKRRRRRSFILRFDDEKTNSSNRIARDDVFDLSLFCGGRFLRCFSTSRRKEEEKRIE